MKRILLLLITACALAPLVTAAQPQFAYTEVKPALQVETEGKIEVLEFFWYGCIHCYNLEPLLEKWVPRLPADTHFRRIPAVFNERWAHDALIFYAFDVLGVLEKLHRPFFDAIHKDRLKTDNLTALGEWLAKNELDPKTFDATMKSFGVQSKAKRAAQLTNASRIDGTPALMVQGRYTISSEQGKSREGMLATADALAGMVRKSLAGRK